jgi:hypothetical protein
MIQGTKILFFLFPEPVEPGPAPDTVLSNIIIEKRIGWIIGKISRASLDRTSNEPFIGVITKSKEAI